MTTLEESIGKLLLKHSLTLSVAESCTGGLVGNRITNIAGSSKYFIGGVISYDNRVKVAMLKIKKGLLRQYGSVSEEVAKKMAENIKNIMDTHIGLSTTGVAGPTGGSVKNPVGLVWVGLSTKTKSSAYQFQFNHGRKANKDRFAHSALQVLEDYLKSI